MVLDLERLKGLDIVFETIDGGGADTQTKLLFDKVKKHHDCIFMDYPDYGNPIGRVLYDALHRKFDVHYGVIVLLQAADQAKDNSLLSESLRKGTTLIRNRSYVSNLAFPAARGFDWRKSIAIADAAGVRRPDIAIFINTSPETSWRRKHVEEKNLDMNEVDLEYQRRVHRWYRYFVENRIFAKRWIEVNGEHGKEEIAREVESKLDYVLQSIKK